MGISHLPPVVGEIVPVERVVELAPVTAVIYKHEPIKLILNNKYMLSVQDINSPKFAIHTHFTVLLIRQ